MDSWGLIVTGGLIVLFTAVYYYFKSSSLKSCEVCGEKLYMVIGSNDDAIQIKCVNGHTNIVSKKN